MALKKSVGSLIVVLSVMCVAIYHMRTQEISEHQKKYEYQIKDQKVENLEENLQKLQKVVSNFSKSLSSKSGSDKIEPIAEVTNGGVVDDAKTGLDKRLLFPRKGQEINPVIRRHIEDLKTKNKINFEPREAAAIAFSKIKQRDINFTPSEEDKIKTCVKNGPRDRSRNGSRFFGPHEKIRRTHHSYLGEDKLMVEVGGNWGWDAGNFSKMYNPRYLILEPLADYVGILRKKFENNAQVSVYNLGLGAKNESIMVTIQGNNACATSKFSGKKGTVPIYIINAVDFLAGMGIGAFDVDLLTMNCEGCEYEALETLLASNIINSFRNIQWATHSTLKMKDPIGRYCKIEQLLLRTHRPTYQYRLIWESWRRKDLD